jgi:hypothetical protein
MERISTDRKTLKKFGITMAIAFLAIAVMILLRHKHNVIPVAVTSLVFFTMAYMRPEILKPAYIAWMKLAFVLSWINTRLILIVMFYLFMTPIALLLKLFGVDLLDRRIDKTKQSYWLPKEKGRQAGMDYERQF